MNDVSESPAARATREEAAKTSPLLLLVPAVIAIVVAAVIALAFTSDDDDTADVSGIEPSEEADDDTAGTADAPADFVPVELPELAARFGDRELSGEDLLAIATGPSGIAPSPQAIADQVTTWLLVEAVTAELSDRGVEVTEQDNADAETAAIELGIPSGTIAFDAGVQLQAVVNVLNDYAVANAVVDGSAVELICSSHILLETEEAAFAAIDRIEAGEDFADVAIELSTGPSGPAGGQLGCVDTTTFVAEYVAGARDNGVGVTEPVESQFGFHVIDVRYLGPLAEGIDPSLTDELFASINASARGAAENIVRDELVAAATERIDADHFIDPAIGVWLFPPGAVQAVPTGG